MPPARLYLLPTSILILLLYTPIASAAPASQCPTITKYLTIGSTDIQVVTLKKFLASEGLLSGVQNTTYFGPSTKVALQTWQRKKGITSSGSPATTGFGATGPKTRAALLNCRGTIRAAVPPSHSPTNAKTPAYSWSVSGWDSCATGAKTLTVTCVSSSGAPAPDTSCPGTKPAPSSSCLYNNKVTTAPQPSYTYAWQTNSWGPCAGSTQNRSITCIRNDGAVSTDTFCVDAKPATTQSCTARTPAVSCTFNGAAVAHGATVTTYQSASVPAGSQCVSEQRTCTNGALSGSFTSPTCAVTATTPCTLDGATIAHGANRIFYSAASIPFSQSCVTISQQRTCTNGILTGDTTFSHASCSASTSIVAFGATPNDQTDDTAAIQAALDAAPDGQDVTIPAGTFITSKTLDVKTAIHLKGQSSETSIIRYASNISIGPDQPIVRATPLNATIDGLTITDIQLDGNRANNTQPGEWNAGIELTTNNAYTVQNARLERLTIRNTVGDGITLRSIEPYVTLPNRIIISDSLIERWIEYRQGIAIVAGHEVTLSGNRIANHDSPASNGFAFDIEPNGFSGQNVRNIHFTNNTIENVPLGINIAHSSEPSIRNDSVVDNIYISGNIIHASVRAVQIDPVLQNNVSLQ